MKFRFPLLLILSSFALLFCTLSCQSDPTTSTETTATPTKTFSNGHVPVLGPNTEPADLTDVPDGLKELVKKAVARTKVPTSVKVNFGSGYWHLGGAVNTKEPGDRSGYEGIWFKLDENQLMTVGKNEKDLYKGAWTWDEEKQQITFMAPLKDDWWLNEWKTINRGDLYICMGNTERNAKSTQFKLVRKHQKVSAE